MAGPDGRLYFREDPLEDESAHLEDLRLAASLIAKCIQMSLPIGHMFDLGLYRRLRRHGMAPGDEHLSSLLLGRINAFTSGVFGIIPAFYFQFLPDAEISLLFEWNLQPISTLANSVFQIVGPDEEIRELATSWEPFIQALASLPSEIVRQLVYDLLGPIRIPKEGFGARSADAIEVVIAPNLDSTLSLDFEHSWIIISTPRTVEQFRVAICAEMLIKEEREENNFADGYYYYYSDDDEDHADSDDEDGDDGDADGGYGGDEADSLAVASEEVLDQSNASDDNNSDGDSFTTDSMSDDEGRVRASRVSIFNRSLIGTMGLTAAERFKVLKYVLFNPRLPWKLGVARDDIFGSTLAAYADRPSQCKDDA